MMRSPRTTATSHKYYNRVERARRFIHQQSPIPKIFVGVLLIAFFILGSILHIQTSEAFYLGGSTVGISANWMILQQPYLFVTGQLDPVLQKAVMWGWGIELVFLICIVGYDKLHRHVQTGNRGLAKLFKYGVIVLVFFDGWTDFNYGSVGSGFWGQLAFALITGFIVFFFGTGGWHLISEGLSDLADQLRGEEDDYED